jgi:hypothetical protein
MSFRLFVYYCALCGAAAAFAGWLLGRAPGHLAPLAEAGLKGGCLGLMVAISLSVLDALWNSSGQLVPTAGRVLSAALVSVLGGFFGGVVGQALCLLTDNSVFSAVFTLVGWTLTGLLIGVSLGVFDLVAQAAGGRGGSGALRKLRNGVLGGTAGGILGSLLFLALMAAWPVVFRHKPLAKLWTPSALGFAVLGACLGLLIGLAQVVLREAWLRVEAGFRAGRELILSRDTLTIGRAESCDLGLFGDPAVDKVHARIVRQNGAYVLSDAGTQAGTYLNDTRLVAPMVLHSGDAIRVGRNLIRFQERPKRK